ncbi:MAG: sensor histidine kinase N-terminal domain-containing protein [Gemmatimonadetes bacterium]|nr:sensor histidine kinase N-terminal domain-containing protein [Gemmatimonadota bacterium]
MSEPRPKSYRLLLARRFTLMLTFALVAIGVVVHLGVRWILLHAVDNGLSSVASVQAAAVAQSPPGAMRLYEWQLAPQEAASVHQVNWFVQVWDPDGRSLLRSSYLDRDLSVDREAFAEAQAGALVFDTGEWDGERVRAVYYPLARIDPGHHGHVLQVATSLASLGATMRRVDLLLLGILVVMMLATFGVGWSTARLAVRPAEEIARMAEGIQTQNLDQRITAHARTLEFQRLVAVLNRMLDRIDDAFEAERRFTSDASHELRSPLTALRGHLEVALRRDRTPEEYRDVLSAALAEVQRMQVLADDLLTLARRDAGVLKPQRSHLRLADIANEVVESFRTLARTKKLQLATELDRGIAVAADPTLLKRLLRNLVDNAIKFTPEGGRVTVAVRLGDGRGVVEVADTGPGISPDALPHLFERFYRGDAARAPAAGAGLGLAIAKALAEVHAGTLTAANRDGGGAVFRLELPLASELGHV